MVFLHHGLDFYLRRVGSMCEKAFTQCSVLNEAANTTTRWKMIELTRDIFEFTRDIFDEVSQFPINFFFFPGWDGMGKKRVRN